MLRSTVVLASFLPPPTIHGSLFSPSNFTYSVLTLYRPFPSLPSTPYSPVVTFYGPHNIPVPSRVDPLLGWRHPWHVCRRHSPLNRRILVLNRPKVPFWGNPGLFYFILFYFSYRVRTAGSILFVVFFFFNTLFCLAKEFHPRHNEV